MASLTGSFPINVVGLFLIFCCCDGLNLTRKNVECSGRAMSLHLSFSQPFEGIVFTTNYPHSEGCRLISDGRTEVTLSIPLVLDRANESYCGVQELDKETYSVQVLVSEQSTILTSALKRISVRCKYALQPKTLTLSPLDTNIDVMIPIVPLFDSTGDAVEQETGSRVVESQVAGEAEAAGPEVRMTVRKGHGLAGLAGDGLTEAFLGDNITLDVFYDSTGGFEVFLHNCSASDGTAGGTEISLVDERGCAVPQPAVTLPPLRIFDDDGTKHILLSMYGFRFPTSSTVNFQCQVQACLLPCRLRQCSAALESSEPSERLVFSEQEVGASAQGPDVVPTPTTSSRTTASGENVGNGETNLAQTTTALPASNSTGEGVDTGNGSTALVQNSTAFPVSNSTEDGSKMNSSTVASDVESGNANSGIPSTSEATVSQPMSISEKNFPQDIGYESKFYVKPSTPGTRPGEVRDQRGLPAATPHPPPYSAYNSTANARVMRDDIGDGREEGSVHSNVGAWVKVESSGPATASADNGLTTTSSQEAREITSTQGPGSSLKLGAGRPLSVEKLSKWTNGSSETRVQIALKMKLRPPDSTEDMPVDFERSELEHIEQEEVPSSDYAQSAALPIAMASAVILVLASLLCLLGCFVKRRRQSDRLVEGRKFNSLREI